MKTLFVLLVTCALFGQFSYASEVENIDENIKALGFDQFYPELKKTGNSKQVKIAIFDYGFDGYQDEMGISIPKNTQLMQRPGDTNVRSSADKNTHGLAMAQILTQYMTKNYKYWSVAPKIYLYKSDGYSNFQWAIDDAIKNGVSIVLHSVVIEYGSNYDGRGFYNALVNRATSAGIVWINAAGNFGLTTYNADVVTNDNGWVTMNDLDKNALPVKCKLPKENNTKKSATKKCNIRLVLAWDDFKNKPLLGSSKDLDLYLLDENFESSITSQLVQIEEENESKGKAGYTLYPREIIETQIPEGTSYIKVKAKSDNFASSDRMRITADGDYVSFPQRDEEESLLNPADNASVITVGEDSSRSSVSKTLNKPELVAPSMVVGDDGKRYKGSSNAAAVVAAGVGLMMELNPDLDREAILVLASKKEQSPQEIQNYPVQQNFQRMAPPAYIPGYAPPQELNAVFKQSSREETADEEDAPVVTKNKSVTKNTTIVNQTVVVSNNPYAIPLDVLKFAPAGGAGCFPAADIKRVEPCVVANFIIKSRSLLVATTSGLKIGTSFDPIDLIPGDVRLNLNDVIAIFPVEGMAFRRIPRNIPLPRGAIELFKIPINEAICKIPDWNFQMSELEVSRRKLYEANATGANNNFIPQSCNAEYLQSMRYPMSNWSMYPILQQSQYLGPVGPAPISSGYGNGQNTGYNNGSVAQNQNTQQNNQGQQQSKENFQLASPSEVTEE